MTKFQDAIDGTLRSADFIAESWKEVAPGQKETALFLKSFGDFSSLTLVDRREEDDQRHYRYRIEFQKATLLYHFIFDKQHRHVFGNPEDLVWKTGNPSSAH